MQSRISMITLGVSDVRTSVKFYHEGLGLKCKEGDENADTIAFFNLNGTWLGLYGRDALAEDATVPSEGSGFRGVALAYNCRSKEDVHAAFDQAIQAGGTAVKEPQDVFWGGYSGYFADPDGHLWEVAWNPHEWIGPPDEDA
jgi:uncharacterized protein